MCSIYAMNTRRLKVERLREFAKLKEEGLRPVEIKKHFGIKDTQYYRLKKHMETYAELL